MCCVVICAGCVKTHNARVGQNLVEVGEVEAYKALTYVGGTTNDTIRITADENGNAIMAAGRGSLELVPLPLSQSAREEFRGQLAKMMEWGQIVKKEQIETKKYVGYVNSSTGIGTAVMLSSSFSSSANGETWMTHLEFCEINAFANTRSASPCTKQVDIYLRPQSVESLARELDSVPEYVKKASLSKSKAELLK